MGQRSAPIPPKLRAGRTTRFELDIRSTYNFPVARTSDPYAPYPGALQPDETKAPGRSNHIGPRPNSFASF